MKLKNDLIAADLINVKRNRDGTLDNSYFLNLLEFVGETARERTKETRKKCT